MDVRVTCTLNRSFMQDNELMVPKGILTMTGLPDPLPNGITKAELEDWATRNLLALLSTILGSNITYNEIDGFLWKLNSRYREKVGDATDSIVDDELYMEAVNEENYIPCPDEEGGYDVPVME